MKIIYVVYCVAASSGIAAFIVLMLAARFSARRRKGWNTTLRDKYLRSVISHLMSEESEMPELPMIDRAGARMQLAEVIFGLVAATYGLDQAPLRRIVTQYGLGEYLLRRIRFSHGYRRARNLALLAHLPADPKILKQADGYTRSRNRYVRFWALMVQVTADSAMVLRLLSDYPNRLSAYEISEIMTLLRRGLLPIAYEPLVRSSNPNLQAVGLGIVRQFGIEEAEKLLRRIVGTGTPELGREALYTLCMLRQPLTGKAVQACVAVMSRSERRALMRFMALEGYSQQTLEELFDNRERPYYAALIQSYKRCLA